MRSYREYCALARALDIVGDRWSLLIVRELLVGPCRYGDLQDNLPGVATNLLADRLRHLEDAGVVTHDGDGRYLLTPWGEHLKEPLSALSRWGAPLMREMRDDDAFRGHWFALPVEFMFGGVDPARPEFVAELRTPGSTATMESAGGEVRFRPGQAASPDLVLTGPPDGIIGVLAGYLDKKTAPQRGVSVLGDLRPLARLRRADWRRGPEACTVESAAFQ